MAEHSHTHPPTHTYTHPLTHTHSHALIHGCVDTFTVAAALVLDGSAVAHVWDLIQHWHLHDVRTRCGAIGVAVSVCGCVSAWTNGVNWEQTMQLTVCVGGVVVVGCVGGCVGVVHVLV